MNAAAIRKGQTDERAVVFKFSIVHNPLRADRWVAERQAQWLGKVLADEHEREKKHPDFIQLP